MRKIFLFAFIFHTSVSYTQNIFDTAEKPNSDYILLSPVVIQSRLNVPAFIEKVKSDTSFYKAFKNLRILGYSAIHDIRMFGTHDQQTASLHCKTKQIRSSTCRMMKVLEEFVTGDMYDRNREFNYYTPKMYASLFFTKDSVCNETNIVGANPIQLNNKSGLEKHKDQLKMLFFNPGKRITGLPFMSRKTEIFSENASDLYDMSIDMDLYNNTNCYVFKQKVKPGQESNVVIDEMTTWFNDSTFEVVARNYSLSYDAGFYDFDVNMEVNMSTFKAYTVPSLIRYHGTWKAIFKKRETGVFTATLFDFEN